MELKKIIQKGALFLLISLAVYLLVMFALVKVKMGGIPLVYRTCDAVNWKGGNTFMKFKEYNPANKYDVLVIGSSHAYRGYDPRIFRKNNIELFNLGTSGQTLLSSYYIAKNYITAANCNLVILDIYDGALAGDGVESTSDLIQNINSDKAAFEMGFALHDPRAINMLTVRMLDKASPQMYTDSMYVGNGFSEKRDSVKKVDTNWYNFKPKINEKQVAYLEKLMCYFSENKIKVLMVSHPAPKETNRVNHQLFSNVVSEIAQKYNCGYWDLEFKYEFETMNDFFDGHHLNQTGVEKFNSILIKELQTKHYFSVP